MNQAQQETIMSLKQLSGLVTQEESKPKKKRKKGGPNPLSVKKKKKPSNPQQTTNTSGRIRKRTKVQLPAHIKEVLKKS